MNEENDIAISDKLKYNTNTKHGEIRGFKGMFNQLFKFLGPAFIVSVAYIDPPMFV